MSSLDAGSADLESHAREFCLYIGNIPKVYT